MLRVASAAVLAPIALASTYAGGWIFLALCAVAAAAVLWEWASLVAATATLGFWRRDWRPCSGRLRLSG